MRGPSGVCSTLMATLTPSASEKRPRKSTMGRVMSSLMAGSDSWEPASASRFGFSAACALDAPLGCRPRGSHIRRTQKPVRYVLLTDGPQIRDHVVNQRARGKPQEDESHDERHEHHHALLSGIGARGGHQALLP